MESWLIAASAASIALSNSSVPAPNRLVEERQVVSVLPLFSVLAAQGGAYWLFPNQQDKQYHAMGCALISSMVTELTGNPWWGIASGVGVGIIKEAIDPSIHGNRDYQDLGADLLGAGMGTMLYWRF